MLQPKKTILPKYSKYGRKSGQFKNLLIKMFDIVRVKQCHQVARLQTTLLSQQQQQQVAQVSATDQK